MNYLDLINNILDNLRLDPIVSITDRVMEIFPYNIIIGLIDEACTVVGMYAHWEDSMTDTRLIYSAGVSSYNLNDYEINRTRIRDVFLINGNTIKTELYPIRYELWKTNYEFLTDANQPYYYCLTNKYIKLYPIPDQDYKITIRHYKTLPKMCQESDDITILDKKHHHTISQYVQVVIAAITNGDNVVELKKEYLKSISKLMYSDRKHMNVIKTLPPRINWAR